MRWSRLPSSSSSPLAALFFFFLSLSLFPAISSAEKILESHSLATCMVNSSFSATLFNVRFTPEDGQLAFNLTGVSEISGRVLVELSVLGYGYTVYHNVIDPCTEEALLGICPMNQGPISNLFSNTQLSQDTIKQVPNAIYYIPDIDGTVIVRINSTDGVPLACVQANLSNTKTVNQKGVAWVIAVIVGLGLAISAITSGLGHSNTAAHVAANALALFSYFQAQAFIGMTAVSSPPIVRAWTQNFQWSMGIVHVGFLQKMATWYQRATGGTPTTLLSNLSNMSVFVQKRSLESLHHFSSHLAKRSNAALTLAENQQSATVRGIVRVGFVAGIESTNIFFTGYVILCVFFLFVTLGVMAFKYICDFLVRAKKLKPEQFHDFRAGWSLVLKGILFRIVLIAFPQMVVLCFWEMTKKDSAAEVVLAVSTIVTMIGLLTWASLKVWRIARRSIKRHKNPAYILYADPKALNKWGFLYVQFKANMYYFIVVVLAYVMLKGMFIAFAQRSGSVQAVSLVIIEGAWLVTISVLRPYMDRKTNGFYISIASINLFNVLLLLFFSKIFNLPALAIGIMGVLFFIVNCVFAIVILIMCFYVSIRALLSKNPDNRYQPMRDDRGSFIKSQPSLGHTELDALGATARGDGTDYDMAMAEKRMGLEYDNDSSVSTFSHQLPPVAATTPANDLRSMSPFDSENNISTIPMGSGYATPASARNVAQFRATNNSSPAAWQKGVGY